jgi:hypothetical protein
MAETEKHTFRCLFRTHSGRRSFSEQRGVEAIELAIALPVFVALLFGCIDVGRMVSGYSTVRAATVIGAREAVGLQRTDWQAVSAVMGDSGEQNPDVSISSFVSAAKDHSPEFISPRHPTDDANLYSEKAGANNIEKLYRLEVRAIAYANKIIADSSGNMDYPCENKPSCFYCFTLRGNNDYYKQYFSVPVGSSSQRIYVSTLLGLECTYDVPITSAAVGLGLLPEFVPVTARVYVPINNYTTLTYDPNGG